MSSSDFNTYLRNSSPLSRLQNSNKIPLQELHDSIDLKMSILKENPRNYLSPKNKLNRSKLKTSANPFQPQSSTQPQPSSQPPSPSPQALDQQFSQMKASSILYSIPQLSPPEITFQISQQLRQKINQLKEDMVTKLPSVNIKSSQFSSNKLESIFSRRVVLKDLQAWLQDKLRTPPLSYEDSLEYKNMIMGVGMKEVIRLIGTRCAEEASFVSEVWELTWAICREIILHLSKRAHKCEKILTEQASFFRIGCQNKIKHCETLVKQLQQSNSELKHRCDKQASDLAHLKKKTKQLKLLKLNLQTNHSQLREQFSLIFKENLILHLKLSPNDQARHEWAKRKYKTYLKSNRSNDVMFRKYVQEFLKENCIEFREGELQGEEGDEEAELRLDVNRFKEEQSRRNFLIQKELHESFRTAEKEMQTEIKVSGDQAMVTEMVETHQISIQTDRIQSQEQAINTDQLAQLKTKNKKDKITKKGGEKKKGESKGKLKTKVSMVEELVKNQGEESEEEIKESMVGLRNSMRGSMRDSVLMKQKEKEKEKEKEIEKVEETPRYKLKQETKKSITQPIPEQQIAQSTKEIHIQPEQQKTEHKVENNNAIEQQIAAHHEIDIGRGLNKVEEGRDDQEKQLEIVEAIENKDGQPGQHIHLEKQPESNPNHTTSSTASHNPTQPQINLHSHPSLDQPLHQLLANRRYIQLIEAIRSRLTEEELQKLDMGMGMAMNVGMGQPERNQLLSERDNTLKKIVRDGGSARKPTYFQFRRKSVGEGKKVSEHVAVEFDFEPDEDHIQEDTQHPHRSLSPLLTHNSPKQSRKPSLSNPNLTPPLLPKHPSTHTNNSLHPLTFHQICSAYLHKNCQPSQQDPTIPINTNTNANTNTKQTSNSQYGKRLLREQYREIYRGVVQGQAVERSEKQTRLVIEKSLSPILKQLCKEMQNGQKLGLQKLQQIKISYIPLHILLTNKFNLNFGVKKVASKHIKDLLLCLKNIRKYTQKYSIIAYFMLQALSLRPSSQASTVILEYQDAQLLFFYILLITVLEGVSSESVLTREQSKVVAELGSKYLTRDSKFVGFVRGLADGEEQRQGDGASFVELYRKIIRRYQELSSQRIKEMSFVFECLSRRNKETGKPTGIRWTDFIKFISAFNMSPRWHSIILNTLTTTLLEQKSPEPKQISYECYTKFLIKCPEFSLPAMQENIQAFTPLSQGEWDLASMEVQEWLRACGDDQFLGHVVEYLYQYVVDREERDREEEVRFWVGFVRRYRLECWVDEAVGGLGVGVLDPRSQAVVFGAGPTTS